MKRGVLFAILVLCCLAEAAQANPPYAARQRFVSSSIVTPYASTIAVQPALGVQSYGACGGYAAPLVQPFAVQQYAAPIVQQQFAVQQYAQPVLAVQQYAQPVLAVQNYGYGVQAFRQRSFVRQRGLFSRQRGVAVQRQVVRQRGIGY